MPSMRLKVSAFFAFGGLLACSKSHESRVETPIPPQVNLTATTISYYRDIKPIMDRSCINCHEAGGIAGFDLSDPKRIQSLRRVVADAVGASRMPPWTAGPDCRSYQFDRSLNAEEKALFQHWADEGGPLGNPSESHEVAPVSAKLSRVDLELKAPSAYTPKDQTNDYRCFVIDWPRDKASYITGFGIRPDKASIVHHVIAYQAAPEQVALVQGLDAASPEPGYECYGGPLPNNGRLAQLAAWAPGGEGRDLPEGTGLKIIPGSKIVIQVHYNTTQNPPLADRSSVLLKLDETVGKEAYVIPFANPLWTQQHSMLIPAGQADVVHGFSADLYQIAQRITGGKIVTQKPLTVYDAALHMHTRGKSASLELSHSDGAKECLLTQPDWDFHWQGTYTFQQPLLSKLGDKLSIECHFDNSGARGYTSFDGLASQPKDLNWGESTEDEMCVGFVYVTQ